MATDDDRRSVAERLRGEVGCGSSWPGMERLGVILGVEGGSGFPGRFLSRLADLIDPGESGQNLDKNRDTVQIESPAVQKAPECDREALLELADILGSTRETDCSGCRLEGAGCAECSSGVAREAARRIREALGVEP